MKVLMVDGGSGGAGLQGVVSAFHLGWGAVEMMEASTERQALECVRKFAPDVVVIDTELPHVDGLALLRQIRRFSDAVAIAVSRHYDEGELIEAVDAGADDYLQLPVSPTLVVARVRAALRRTRGSISDEEEPARYGDLEVDPARREARMHGQLLQLTATEFELLLYLARRSGRVARHESLCSLIWGDDQDLYSPWLRKYIQHLRHKLAQVPQGSMAIATVPKVGYKLVMNGAGTPPWSPPAMRAG